MDTISNMRLEPFTSYNCNIYNNFSTIEIKGNKIWFFGVAADGGGFHKIKYILI